MNKPIVLDASAVLALLHREPGSQLVAERMQNGAVVSSVNVAEVLSKQQELQIPSVETISLLELMGIHIHFFDTEAAVCVGNLRNSTKSLGLSLGDRACLALGDQLKCPVLTADRIWSQLHIGVEIIVIR